MEAHLRPILKDYDPRRGKSPVVTDRGEVLSVDPVSLKATAVITTAREDRSKDIVDPMGMRLNDYSRTPIVMWEHGKLPGFSCPLGTSRDPATGEIAVVPQGERAIATAWFIEPKTAEYAQIIACIMDGIICGTSVQMLPRACVARGPKLPGRDRPPLHITEWDLLEWSWVAVPDNPDAVRTKDECRERIREVVSLGRVNGERLLPTIAKSLQSYLTETPTLFKGWDMAKDEEDDELDTPEDTEDVNDEGFDDELYEPGDEDEEDDDMGDEEDVAEDDMGDEDSPSMFDEADEGMPMKQSAEMLVIAHDGLSAIEMKLRSDEVVLDNDYIREDALPGIYAAISETKALIAAAMKKAHPTVSLDEYETDPVEITKSFAFAGVVRGGLDRAVRTLRTIALESDLSPQHAAMLGGTILAMEVASEMAVESPIVKSFSNDDEVAELRDALESQGAELEAALAMAAKYETALTTLKQKLTQPRLY